VKAWDVRPQPEVPETRFRVLERAIHDRDSKFTAGFDRGVPLRRHPDDPDVRAPRANA
jgi:hypothetical protein